MKQPMLPLGVAAMMAVAISVAAGVGVIVSGQRLDLAFAVAAFLLAGSHLVIFIYRDFHYRGKFATMGDMHQRSRKLAERLSDVTARLDLLEEEHSRPAPPPGPDPSEVSREFEELRRSIKELAEAYGRAPEISDAQPPAPGRTHDRSPGAESDERRALVVHHLEF